MSLDDLVMDVSFSVDIEAPIGDVFAATVRRFGERNSMPDGTAMPMVLEEWPGGRWFRDLGNKQGHLWGFVQVIKPPTLIEIQGPMFMSYPVAGHLSLRLSQEANGTKLTLRNQILGFVQDGHKKGIGPGWEHQLAEIKKLSEI